MKKLVVFVLLLGIGFVCYSQNISTERIIIGRWANDVVREYYDFIHDGSVLYQKYVIRQIDNMYVERYWESSTGTYSVDGNKIKIRYSSQRNVNTSEVQSTTRETELEVVRTGTLPSLFNGSQHFSKTSH
jgi:hypothetical protein